MSARTDRPEPARRPRRSGRPRRRGWARVRRVLLWLVTLGVVGAMVLALVAVVAYQRTTIPDPNAEFLTQTTRIYYDDGRTEIGQLAIQKRTSIDYDQMPACIKQGVVAAENRTFWTDRGIDPKGILRAAFSNAKGNATQGASTITQQYVKILYLTQERSLKRKVREAFLSLKMQNTLSKREILEGYLNTIYFGRGAYGIEAAAQTWFGVGADELGLRQCAVLASLVNNPVGFDPANGSDARTALAERYRYVLDGMALAGDIPEARAERAGRRLPAFPDQASQNTYGGQRGHALTLVKQQLLALRDGDGQPLFTEEQVSGGGLQITTTLQPQVMDAARDGVLEERPEGFSDRNLHIGVATVEPGTGALRGFYGGQDFLRSQLNWATQRGMAGSTMKAFTVAAAIQQGYELSSVFDGNSPYELPGGVEVENEGDNDYGSSVSMTKATEDSINTAFVDMTESMDDGPRAVFEMARAMGIPPQRARAAYAGIPSTSTDFTPEDALVTLGKARVSPVNLANAYATIANGGVRNDAYVVERVTDPDGKVLYQHRDDPVRVLDEDIDADTSYALEQVVRSGTGTAALALGRDAAGKTGTATNGQNQVSSAWFVGYTPQLSTAVMYLRGDGDDQLDGWLPEYFGGSYPARTWAAVMEAALEGTEEEELPDPEFVDGDPPEEGHTYVPPPPPPSTPQSRPPRSTRPPQTTRPPSTPAAPATPAAPSSPAAPTVPVPSGAPTPSRSG